MISEMYTKEEKDTGYDLKGAECTKHWKKLREKYQKQCKEQLNKLHPVIREHLIKHLETSLRVSDMMRDCGDVYMSDASELQSNTYSLYEMVTGKCPHNN